MKAPAEERSGRRTTPAPPPRAATDADTGPTINVREPDARPLSRGAVQRLQAGAGNRAVSALVVQRRAAAPRTPAGKRPGAGGGGRGATGGVPAQRSTATVSSAAGTTPTTSGPASAPVTGGPGPGGPELAVQRLATDPGQVHRPGPQADPKFAALKADVRGKQQLLAAHPPARAEATKAQGAAKPPQDDKEAQGKAANAEKMNAAKPGEFDKAAFVRAVNEAIAAQAPKNLDEADKFGDSGKANAVKGQVQGQVTDGKKASANAIETTTKAPPDTSKAKEKPVTPLVPDKPPGTPGTPDPAKAVPDKAPPTATDLSDGPKQVDQQMADAQVTEEQLAKSNEPEFTGALKEKAAVEQHATTAPGQVRASETRTLAGAKAAAGAAGAAAMTALATNRKQAGTQVGAGKDQAKSADETKRARATATLQKVFDATKKDVEDILSGLDKTVDDKFTAGEKAARDAFTAEHKRRMDEYKDKRYSGLLGKGRWLKDKFAGLPEEANQIFVTARKGYVDRMQQVISGVADVIGAELTRAKQRIATGRDQLQAEVKRLPPDLQAIGKEAAGEFAGKFDELTESVNNKSTELVQTLATKYNEALKSVDEEIAAEKEKNKGLVAKAVDAVAGVIKTIMQLKDMLMGVLAKAAQAVMAIIKDPIGFLGNLVSAVGAGLRAFLANIGEHLKKGLVGWLTGAMAGAGLELPAKFDLRGIVMMIGSLLGLTWGAIRGRIIQRGLPAQAMGAVEQSVPLVQKVQAQGLGGIWEEIKEKVGDLKESLFSKISEYLIPTILMAGITWIISLLNPASAFVRAVKMIIDFVSFIVNQGAQILEFVNSVLDAIIAIAGGGAGGVPALIEKALARSVPVLIGALAAILGIGGIAEKVKKFFQALSKPVMKAVDWVVGKIVGLGKKLWAKLRAKTGRRRGEGRAPDEPSRNERLSPQEVKAKAARELRARIASGVDSADQLNTAVRDVHHVNSPLGLRSIDVKPGGFGKFKVYVTASPAELGATTEFDKATKFLKKDFTVRVSKKTGRATGIPHTALVGKWNGHALPRQESFDKDHHAEDVLTAFIDANRDRLPRAPEGQRDRLDVTITKSPCERCGGRLQLYASTRNVHLSLSIIGLYRGRGTNEEKQASIDAMIKLRSDGHILRVPTLAEVLSEYGGDELDDVSKKALQGRLDGLKPIVDNINAEAAKMETIKAGT